MRVRARVQMSDGFGAQSYWSILLRNENYTFTYVYDPQLGAHGRLTVIIDDRLKLAADLTSEERGSNVSFDAFGMGVISTMNSEDDPTKMAKVYIDDVSYSGCRKLKEPTTWVRVETPDNVIVTTGTRWGKPRPGSFLNWRGDEPAGCAAGSFEYCLQPTQQPKEEGAQ
jgi:hypothetical protein